MANINSIVTELEKGFKLFNEKLFKDSLPDTMIVIQTSGNGKKKLKGWFTMGKLWKDTQDNKYAKYEITICPEFLKDGIYDILGTLLHEMVHLYCQETNVKDTSNNGVYHNRTYKETAMAHGLNVASAKTIGWSVTELDLSSKRIVDESDIDKEIFRNYREKIYSPSKAAPRYKYICPTCGVSFWHTKKDIKVICGICSKSFDEINPNEEKEDNEEKDDE